MNQLFGLQHRNSVGSAVHFKGGSFCVLPIISQFLPLNRGNEGVF